MCKNLYIGFDALWMASQEGIKKVQHFPPNLRILCELYLA